MFVALLGTRWHCLFITGLSHLSKIYLIILRGTRCIVEWNRIVINQKWIMHYVFQKFTARCLLFNTEFGSHIKTLSINNKIYLWCKWLAIKIIVWIEIDEIIDDNIQRLLLQPRTKTFLTVTSEPRFNLSHLEKKEWRLKSTGHF